DSAGARIQATSGSTFAAAGALFREQGTLSGVVPMVAAMLGHCAAGTAYIPALAASVPLAKGGYSKAPGGPHLGRRARGGGVSRECGRQSSTGLPRGIRELVGVDAPKIMWVGVIAEVVFSDPASAYVPVRCA